MTATPTFDSNVAAPELAHSVSGDVLLSADAFDGSVGYGSIVVW